MTPVVAVLRELSNHHSVEMRFWCDRSFAKQAKSIINHFDPTLPVDTVVSGKLRRYHHLTLRQHLTIPSVVFPNLRDMFFVAAGTIQSIFKLIAWRPDVVFTKGGYVCLPVGWAAALLRIPIVVHDSDAHPGLTSRLLAGYATFIATGAPLEYYSYPASKSSYVGVPVSSDFRPFTDAERLAAKQQLGVDPNRPLVVITGGGLGAKRINDAVAFNIDQLMEIGTIILISGNDQYLELASLTPVNDSRFQLHAFVSKDMILMLGAADVVVSRAGQTTILELAALGTPTILVPNGRLTGGHQTKNAKVYLDKHAVIVADENRFESDLDELILPIKKIISDRTLRQELSKNIRSFARPNAAKDVAALILRAAKK